jgi:hypothetical protein
LRGAEFLSYATQHGYDVNASCDVCIAVILIGLERNWVAIFKSLVIPEAMYESRWIFRCASSQDVASQCTANVAIEVNYELAILVQLSSIGRCAQGIR